MLEHRGTLSTIAARVFFVILSWSLLSACSSSIPRLSITSTPLSALPLVTQTPTRVAAFHPIRTPTPTRTATSRPASTPTRTLRPPTSTPTLTPTPTVEPWVTPLRRYYFPVQPPRIASYANEHHDYPAADIFVPIGSVVIAVTDGVVDEVSRVDKWDAATNDGSVRGGLWVTLIGADGVRYHTSHLSSVLPDIEAGVVVHAGQIIGFSGNSGNATHTPPHVHFGISHPTYPGDWQVRRGEVWPFDFLKAWTRGEDREPRLP